MELRTSQVLLCCYDHWLQAAAPAPRTATVVLQALLRALAETAREEDEDLESVGALLRRRAPALLAARARGRETPLQLKPLSKEDILY